MLYGVSMCLLMPSERLTLVASKLSEMCWVRGVWLLVSTQNQ